MNIFKYWKMMQDVENAHINDVIGDELLIIDYELLDEINNNYRWWKKRNREEIKEWLNFGDNKLTCTIPWKLVDYSRGTETNASQCFCVVRYQNELIGLIAFHWSDREYIYNFQSMEDETIQCTYGSIIASGLFAQPISLDNVNIPNSCGIDYIPLIDRDIILRKEKTVYYNSKLRHDIGFIKQELKATFTGDMKEMYNFIGHCGASAKFPCPWCLIDSMQNEQKPNINNRNSEPRHYGSQLEYVWDSERKEKIFHPHVKKVENKYQKTYGCKGPSVCKYYPHTLGAPTVHQFGGKCGRYILCIKNRILKYAPQDKETLEKIEVLNEKIYFMNSEVVILNSYKEQLTNDNVENKLHSPSPGLLEEEKKDDHIPWNISGITETLNDKIKELNKLKTEKKQLDNKLHPNSDRLDLWNKYKEKAKFEELTYRKQEIIGPCAIEWIDNYECLLTLLKPIDKELFDICEFLMPCLKFILHVGLHKNYVLLSDECIECHKWAILQEDLLGRLLVQICDAKYMDKNQFGVGVKQHVFYHNHSRMEDSRVSTGHYDDQRCENMMKKVKKYIRTNKNSLTKIKIRSMMCNMNSEQGLCLDPDNIRGYE